MNTKETYELNVQCNNCDFKGDVIIKKGKTLKEADCPTCGCKSLNKFIEPPVYNNFNKGR